MLSIRPVRTLAFFIFKNKYHNHISGEEFLNRFDFHLKLTNCVCLLARIKVNGKAYY